MIAAVVVAVVVFVRWADSPAGGMLCNFLVHVHFFAGFVVVSFLFVVSSFRVTRFCQAVCRAARGFGRQAHVE